jgi:hypothetical protein
MPLSTFAKNFQIFYSLLIHRRFLKKLGFFLHRLFPALSLTKTDLSFIVKKTMNETKRKILKFCLDKKQKIMVPEIAQALPVLCFPVARRISGP